jgi:WD40-like Beta Propeller Repeat
LLDEPSAQTAALAVCGSKSGSQQPAPVERRRGVLVVILASSGAPALAATGPGHYFLAPFEVHRSSYTFGQTPASTRGGGVLSNEPDSSGIEQVYVSRLNGSRLRCVTCGRLPGPNGFPEERPEGDWILFCSMGAQPEHYGAPCLGGYGTDLYVMRPNGTDITRLTRSSDPRDGVRYDRPGAVPYDNYHVYWSPDGRQIVWTRTEAYPLSQGGQRWEILLADFVAPAHGRPHLAHVRVVGRAFGVYETQAWAPDGSGFLFTAFGPRQSPYQATPPGWMHLELYYMRLYGRGASPEHPRVTRLTDNDPAYEEQAVFTPDMRDVIVMSSRATPGTWYQTVITAALWTGFDAPDPGSAGAPMFVADFADPRFTADLWMVDLATGAVRQLTNFHRVIPEFEWNFGYTKLLWSGNARPDSHLTWVSSFAGVTAAQRRIPRTPAPGLFGEPLDMARVESATKPVRDLRTPGLLPPAQLGIPWVRLVGGDRQTLPPVAISYLTLLDQELHDLATLAAGRIEQPPL